MSNIRKELSRIIETWQSEADRDGEGFNYRETYEDILFRAEKRFIDYVQYENEEGPFLVRLKNWIDNLSDNRERKYLFQMLKLLEFYDEKQMKSLYISAYRSIVTPWIIEDAFNIDDYFSIDYKVKLLKQMKTYYLRSITESFKVSFFKQVNSLAGLPKLKILGENIELVEKSMEKLITEGKKGMIIFEDMVGSGNQARKVLEVLVKYFPEDWRSIFVPLIVQESGLKSLRNNLKNKIQIEPVIIIKEENCIRKEPDVGERKELSYFRGLINRTKKRVLEPLHEHDDPPNPDGHPKYPTYGHFKILHLNSFKM